MPALLRAIVPPGLRERLALAKARRRIMAARDRLVELDGLRIRFADASSLYVEYKDIFVRRIYDAPCGGGPAPRIIDGGACIGMSVLRFKQQHPGASITAFEPDPAIRSLLAENVAANRLAQVRIEAAGLAGTDGELTFAADGSDGGRVSAQGTTRIPVRRLSPYLESGADLVKLNIEGQELAVLEELAQAERLRSVGQYIIEYHGWPDQPASLGRLLALFEAHGFAYLVHDFDAVTNPASKPPFVQPSDRAWFCLVSATRR